MMADVHYSGFPFIYKESGMGPIPVEFANQADFSRHIWTPINLVLDIIIWVAVALGITFLEVKIRKKKSQQKEL